MRVLKKPKYKYMVSWEKREEGLFRFNNAQAFAALWGKHRNRPQMSYDKVARALRYYYDGDLIHKVCGKRFVYQFVCDLKLLLGYSAEELNRLVSDSSHQIPVDD